MPELIESVLSVPEVDAAVDAVGFEANCHGHNHEQESPATVLNAAMEITQAGGRVGIPGLYVTEDPGASSEDARHGNLSMKFGLGWAKAMSFHTGQTPAMRYQRQLMQAILHEKTHIGRAVNVTTISLDEAPDGYADFDKGVAQKFVIDPHGVLG